MGTSDSFNKKEKLKQSKSQSADNNTENIDTFVCAKCGKELRKKYLYKINVCIGCSTAPKKIGTAQSESANKAVQYRDKKYLRKLFTVFIDTENQLEFFVCYDTFTGIAYLIKDETIYAGHAIISSWHGQRLTYEQVALFAQNYAPDSSLVNINNTNWKDYFFINKTAQSSNPTSMNSVTRTATIAHLSDALYAGTIIFPTTIDWKDIEASPRFRFSGEPHFDEVAIGLITQGKYKDQLFITIINDGYPGGVGCGTAELLPENNRSYEGVKRYISGRRFSVYNPISKSIFIDSLKQLSTTISNN